MTKLNTLLGFCLLLAAGCATVPKPLQGEFAATTPRQAGTEDIQGTHVRWGGSLVSTQPNADGTCLNIVARPLAYSARPRLTDVSLGRFRACTENYLEPDIFRPGRAVTVTGRVTGTWQGMVGEYPYDYPLVQADTIFLWPPFVHHPHPVLRPVPVFLRFGWVWHR